MRAILTLTALALVGTGCAACDTVPDEEFRPSFEADSRIPRFAGSERPLVNEDWQVLRMATAHGVMTIEIELGDLEGDHAITGVDLGCGDSVSASDAPGTSYLVVAGPHELREGDRVAVGLDSDPNGGPNPLIAWLVVVE